MKNTEKFIVSERLTEFVKECEGLRTKAYRCPSGVWTAGYGHTGKEVNSNTVVSESEAETLLRDDLKKVGLQIAEMAEAASCKLTDNQTDALTSFAFNVGISALKGSTLWKKIIADAEDPGIETQFNRWVYSKGVKLPGLVKRRQREYEMYNSHNRRAV